MSRNAKNGLPSEICRAPSLRLKGFPYFALVHPLSTPKDIHSIWTGPIIIRNDETTTDRQTDADQSSDSLCSSWWTNCFNCKWLQMTSIAIMYQNFSLPWHHMFLCDSYLVEAEVPWMVPLFLRHCSWFQSLNHLYTLWLYCKTILEVTLSHLNHLLFLKAWVLDLNSDCPSLTLLKPFKFHPGGWFLKGVQFPHSCLQE